MAPHYTDDCNWPPKCSLSNSPTAESSGGSASSSQSGSSSTPPPTSSPSITSYVSLESSTATPIGTLPSSPGSGTIPPSSSWVPPPSSTAETGSSFDGTTQTSSPPTSNLSPEASASPTPPFFTDLLGSSLASQLRPSSSGNGLVGPLVSSNPSKASRRSKAGAVAGGVVGGFIFVGLLILAFIIYLKRRRRSRTPPSAEFMRNPPTSRGASLPFLGQDRPLTPTPYQTVRNDSPDEFDEDRPPPFKEGTYTFGDPLYEKINQSQLQAVAI